jgi:cupin fold WbuC family metalloprotein
MSLIRLNDSERVLENRSGRTPALFCQGKPITLDRALIADLIARAEDSGGDLRLCLHQGPEENFHDMIIVQHGGGYYRPHRHLDKGETWHMLHGRMGVFVFDETGAVTDAKILSPDANFLYRVGNAQYHTLVPLTSIVAYHESKPGPFMGPGDSLFAPWAPDGSDAAIVSTYLERLKSLL